MKKIHYIVFVFMLLISLFAGCKNNNTQQDTTEASRETEGTMSTESISTENTTGATNATVEATVDDTQATVPWESEEDPTSTPEPKPTEGGSSLPKPTEGTQEDPSKNDDDIIAGDKWDGGPVTWKITRDGVLIITGNRSIQEKPSYIWKDYSHLITKVVFSDGITSIPRNAFSQMENITSVELGSGLEKIEAHAFWACTALQSVTFPDNLKTIGYAAFCDCTSLQTISFSGSSRLQRICESAFARSGILEFVAPASLGVIESKAFNDCKQLETVDLEKGPSSVLGQAFTNCTGLQTLILGEAVTSMGGFVFDNCKAITTLENYSPAFGGLSDLPHLTTLVIGGNRSSSGKYSDCPSLTNVTILSDITTIKSGAFRDCPALSEITIPSTVQVIESSAFRNTGLTSVTIPDSVREISVSAFLDTPLTEIIFTGDAPDFANSTVFSGVTATAYYPEGNATWTPEVQKKCGGTLTWVAH